MKTIELEINGKQVVANEGDTILEAAIKNGIHIPTLCHNSKVKPSGVCRLCMVEIRKKEKERKRIVASCVYPVEEDLVVETETDKIKKIRSMIVELLWPSLPELAREYGITKSRFYPKQTDCNLCGLCVRYCSEVMKKNTVYFKGRGVNREVSLVPDMMNECAYCRECFYLCTGGRIVEQCDNYYQSLSSHSQ